MRVCAFLSIISLSLLLLTFYSAVPAHAALSWNVQIVDAHAAGIGNGYCPIVVDSKNMPHIAYTGFNEKKYASWNGSGWTAQQVSSGFVTDLALDANGNPHILLGGGVLGPLSYASWTGTEWTIQTVASTLNHNVVYASLALDSSGNPQAAYTYGEGLEYASWAGSNWNIQTIDTSPDINIRLSLAL